MADYDGDGDLDLYYVANMFGPNSLYQNNGDGTFHDVTESCSARPPGARSAAASMRTTTGGLDSCTWSIRTGHGSRSATRRRAARSTPGLSTACAVRAVAEGELGYPVTGQLEKLTGKVLFGNSFFHNLGGKFEEMSDRAGLETYWPWAITVADFDRDGWKDVFVTAGMSYPYFYWPNSLLRNDGNLHFTDLTRDAGLEPRPGGNELDLTIKNVKWARSSRTAAVLDLDEDGDLDLVVNNFNDVPYVYANESPARHWVALDLVGGGGKTCRDAVGSVVTIEAGGKKQTAMVDSATGYLEQSTHRLYFGLGDAASLTHATVRWIGGAEEDVTAQVAIDKVNVVKQKK
ncbi:MAG: CRTAC1 family protein [Planctomycetota bacterium]